MSSKQSFPESFLCKDQIEKSKEDLIPQDSWVEVQEGAGTIESILPLKLSATLVRKLMEKAQVEGVSIEDLAGELLAEGLVLRAWEIVEKKNAMRSPSNNPNTNGSSNHRNQKFGFRGQGHHVKRMNGSNYSHDNGSPPKTARQNYNHIMEDNANFLEYVRNQEKNQDKY